MDYFSIQTEITEETRSHLIDWLVGVKVKKLISRDALFLAVVLLDKYLCTENIKKINLQAIGAACLFIANKVEDIDVIDLDDLISHTDNTHNKKEILESEFDILQKLKFNVYHKTICHSVRIISREKQIGKKDYCFCIYLSMIILMTIDYSFFSEWEIGEKIVEFAQLIQKDNLTVENSINGNPVYFYLYARWLQEKQSGLTEINKFISSESFCGVSQTDPPQIQSKFDPKTYSLRSICFTEIKPLEHIVIYSSEQFQKRVSVENLGSGTFGTVYKTNFNNQIVAHKKFTSSGDFDGIHPYMLREVNSLHVLKHPAIIKMFGIYYDPKESTMNITMELMNQNLNMYIQNNSCVKYDLKKKWIVQLLNGLAYMHDKCIMHRDLSINNILIGSDGNLKISDFGSSRNFHHEKNVFNFSGGLCALYFRSIELLLQKSPYSNKIDVWSSACVIGFILQEKRLFDYYTYYGITETGLIQQIFKILGTPTMNSNKNIMDWPGLSQNYGEYTRVGFSGLEKNYPTETEILYKMLIYDPDERINAVEAKKLFEKIYTA